MAFENYPENEPTKPSYPGVPEKKHNFRVILTMALVVALLGTWGYIIYDKNKTAETISQKDTIITATTTQREQLQKELEEAALKYDELKTTDSQKDSSISVKDREIMEKKSMIQKLLSKSNATQAELTEAKRLIRSLNGDLETYREQIAVLQQEKTTLTTEKAQVTSERDKERQNYDSANRVIKQKEELVNIGSTLHVSNFNIIGINEKNGREKTTTTAKRVDKLRISFDVDENMISESGTKELYITVTAPDGSVVTVPSMGSGSFKTRDGAEKTFTHKLAINYTKGKRQTVSFDFTQDKNFITGDYKIEVYNNGFKIGEGTRPLKKGGLFS